MQLATYTKFAPYLWKHWLISKYIDTITTEGTRNSYERLNYIRISKENKKMYDTINKQISNHFNVLIAGKDFDSLEL